uniref:Uncharacterized protein n=1 Tax=Steinernema glaseri TaxID=37863 RepID=A0A1I7ZCS0_9BILA
MIAYVDWSNDNFLHSSIIFYLNKNSTDRLPGMSVLLTALPSLAAKTNDMKRIKHAKQTHTVGHSTVSYPRHDM